MLFNFKGIFFYPLAHLKNFCYFSFQNLKTQKENSGEIQKLGLCFISFQLNAGEADGWKTWTGSEEDDSLKSAETLSSDIIKYEEDLVKNTLWHDCQDAKKAREHIYAAYFHKTLSESSFLYRASFGLSCFLEGKKYSVLHDNRDNYTLRIALNEGYNTFPIKMIISAEISKMFPDCKPTVVWEPLKK